MKWIGLTGGLGTGKSTAARTLRKWGYVVIDADQIAKDVVGPKTAGLQSVLAEFGKEFLREDGDLDRHKMAQKIFRDPQARQRLEAIIHPLVQAEVLRQKEEARKNKADLVFYDVPLLFEKKISGFDAVVVISSTSDLQRERLKKRNHWTDQEIDERLRSQWPLQKKELAADFVVRNDGTEEELENELRKLIGELTS